jgi:hypothetical protein
MSDALKDGDYKIPVTLKGGSGRAGIASPAPVHVEDKKTTAEITWSSEHYDYMKVDGKKIPEDEQERKLQVRDPYKGHLKASRGHRRYDRDVKALSDRVHDHL